MISGLRGPLAHRPAPNLACGFLRVPGKMDPGGIDFVAEMVNIEGLETIVVAARDAIAFPDAPDQPTLSRQVNRHRLEPK